MRAVFWKLFGAFWLTTLAILAVSIFLSFKVADEQSPYSFADPREIDELLQGILQSEGIEGLERHVANPDNFPPGQTVYLIDSGGKDLLDRRVPDRISSRVLRIWSRIGEHRREHHDLGPPPPRLRLSLLETSDGRRFLAMPGPAPPQRFPLLFSGSGRWAILALAAAISLLSFWLLSRSLTRPVARISSAAARLAAGDMASRVGSASYTRDEIGQLAAQFDRMAEELDLQSKTRRELFRNIAHELRAPLTRLHIATELLQRQPDKAREQIERIRYEIERVEDLASQVLALARAEQVLEGNGVTALCGTIEQVVADAEFEAAAHGVRIRFDRPDSDVQINGNPDAIASAVENIVRNAIQNTPEGGEVAVTVSGSRPVCVTVADTGPGVPETALEKIFEPFYRIDTNRPGAGIGLAIARRVLQQLGGEIVAFNQPAGGLRITLRFPPHENS